MMRSTPHVAALLGSLLSLTHAAPTLTSATPRPTLWKPITPASGPFKWQYQISTPPAIKVDNTVDIYDVDLYDTSPEDWAALKANTKIKIVCYFSAGSLEEWRDDYKQFDLKNGTDYGPGLSGWDGEYWFDTRSQKVRDLMTHRINYAATRGCDGIEPDNVDAFDNPDASPLGLSQETAMDYLKFLVNVTAHPLNLAVGLKNGVKLVPDVSWWTEFAVNEECAAPPGDNPTDPPGPNECLTLVPFVNQHKPVLHVEYDDAVPNLTDKTKLALFCDPKTMTGFSTVLKHKKSVDDKTQYCP